VHSEVVELGLDKRGTVTVRVAVMPLKANWRTTGVVCVGTGVSICTFYSRPCESASRLYAMIVGRTRLIVL